MSKRASSASASTASASASKVKKAKWFLPKNKRRDQAIFSKSVGDKGKVVYIYRDNGGKIVMDLKHDKHDRGLIIEREAFMVFSLYMDKVTRSVNQRTELKETPQ